MLLSIPLGRARFFVFSAFCLFDVRGCASVLDWSTSPGARFASLVLKAPSTRWASPAVSLFFSPRHRCAHIAASSLEPRSSSSAINRSRNSADASGPSIGLLEFEPALRSTRRINRRAGFWCPPFNRRFPSPFGVSAPDVWFVGRSGASRSSSPAMPTRVKSA